MTVEVIEKWNDTYVCIFKKDDMVNPYDLFGVFGFAVTLISIKNETYKLYYTLKTERKNRLPYHLMETIWKQIREQLFN